MWIDHLFEHSHDGVGRDLFLLGLHESEVGHSHDHFKELVSRLIKRLGVHILMVTDTGGDKDQVKVSILDLIVIQDLALRGEAGEVIPREERIARDSRVVVKDVA